MTGPFDDLFKSGQGGPFDDLFETDLKESAVGRRQYTARNIEDNLDRLRTIQQSTTDETQRARVGRLIAALEKQRGGWTRGVTEDRNPASNLARGVAAGFGTTIPAVADLAATPFDLIATKMGFDGPDQFRRWLAEQSEQVREYYDPQGKAGLAGEVIGAVGAGAVPFGAAASATAKVTGVSKALRAAKASTSVLKRVGAHVAENVVGGAPINITQALGMKEATPEDKAKQLTIGTLADVVFGAAGGLKKPKLKLDIGAKGEPAADAAQAARANEAADMVRKAEAKKEARTAIEQLVADRWNQEHPKIPWSAITAKAKSEFRKQVRAEVEAELKRRQDEGGSSEGPGAEPAPLRPKDPTAPGGEKEAVVPEGEIVANLKKGEPTEDQLRYLRDAGGDDDPLIKDIRNKTDMSVFEKQRLIDDYRKRLEHYRNDPKIKKMLESLARIPRTAKEWYDDHLSAKYHQEIFGTAKDFSVSFDDLTPDAQSIVEKRWQENKSKFGVPTDKTSWWNSLTREQKNYLMSGTGDKPYDKLAPDEKDFLDQGDFEETKKEVESVPLGGESFPDIPISDSHPDLQESEIANAWDGMSAADRRRYLSTTDIPDIFWKEIEGLLWDEIHPDARRSLFEHIKEDRRQELENPFQEIDLNDPKNKEIRDMVDENFRAAHGGVAFDEVVEILKNMKPGDILGKVPDYVGQAKRLLKDKYGYTEKEAIETVNAAKRFIGGTHHGGGDTGLSHNPDIVAERLGNKPSGAKDWWFSLSKKEQKRILNKGGFGSGHAGKFDWDKAPGTWAQVRRYIEEQFSQRRDAEGWPKGTSSWAEPPGISAKGPPLAKDWWEKYAKDHDLIDVINDWLKSEDPAVIDEALNGNDPRILLGVNWDNLPESLKSHVDNTLKDLYGPPEVDLGRTVNEPSAKERFSNARVPDDVRAELVDLVIDAEVEKWDDATMQEKLDDYAARNEVSRDQVDQTLRDLGLGEPRPNVDKAAPSLPEAISGAPEPTPSISRPGEVPVPSTDLSSTLEPSLTTPRKPLADLSLEEIDALKDQLFAELERHPGDPAVLAELDELAAETQARHEASAEGQATIDKANSLLPPEPSIEVRQASPKSVEPAGPSRMDPTAFGKLARTSPSKLSDADLDAVIEEAGWRIAELPEGENDVYKSLQDKLLAEKSRRRPPPLDAQFPAGLGGFTAGFAYGWLSSDDDDRMSNALMWGGIGLGVGLAGRRVANSFELTKTKEVKPEMYPGQHSMPKFIQYTDEKVTKKFPWMARARAYYDGVIRSTGGIENIFNKLGGSKLPDYRNFSKLASIYGRWVGVSDYWQTVQPIIDIDGKLVPLDALPLAKIRDIAKGDIENLDELAVAMTTLENLGKPGWKPPIDPMRAQLIYTNMPEHLHQAARELRKYFLAQADVLVASGNLSQATRDKWAQEAWYTALHRVVGQGESESWAVKQLEKFETITSPQPVKPRKGGSSLKVKSPWEIAQEMTSRVIRAAEFNKIKQEFLAFGKAQPAEIRASLLKRVDQKAAPVLGQVQKMSDEIRGLLPAIPKDEAERLSAAFGGHLEHDAPTMTVYEEGVIRTYQVNQTVFDAFKHLLPQELSLALRALSWPTRFIAKAIVYNPAFIQAMSTIDTFQVALQSRYGFIPGVDSFKGWWAAMRNTPQYQKLLAAGGPGVIQSLSYVEKTSARKVLAAAGANPLETAANLVREGHPWEAYKMIVHPIAEAARVGEGLRALNHGASPIEAVYAAWHAAGNTRMQGNFGAMRAFNMLTLFSRPAIAALDEAVTKSGINPFRRPTPSTGVMAQMLKEMGMKNDRVVNGAEFWLKGFTYLTIPTAIIWYLGKDDQEIQEMRKTSSGRKYWWFRLPNETLMKIRKPHVLGQIFGSTIEDILDKDPTSASWVGGLMNDAAINVVPQIGVVPLSLWANRQIGLGSSIVPEGDVGLLPEYQGMLESSNPARIVAGKLGGISAAVQPESMLGLGRGLRTMMSPAGIDYLVKSTTGMMGQDALLTLDWFINKQRLDMPPAANELPVVGRLFGKFPSMNTKSVRDFYRVAAQVETIQKSFNELLIHKPQLAVQFQARHQLELQYADVFQQNRATIAGYRRQIEDLKFMMQNGQIGHEEFKMVEEEVLKRVIQIAAATLQVASPLLLGQ